MRAMNLRPWLFGVALLVAAPALAQDPHATIPDPHAGVPGYVPAGHPGEVAGEHAAPHEGAEHAAGGHGAHHADYRGDGDHDGQANWLDSDSPDYMVGKLAQHAFNLAVLLAVLFFAARRPVGDALGNRAISVRQQLTDAARERDEARHKHDEIVARLAVFEAEVVKMRADAEVDAKAEEAKLVARAEDEAKRIGETAERNIRDEVNRARVALRSEAVELAVKLAEQTLKQQVEGDDQRRLARQFLDSMNTQVNRHG